MAFEPIAYQTALAALSIEDVLDCMPGGFFVYRADAGEDLIYANDACCRIFGCGNLDEFKELTGFTFPGMVHPDDLAAVERSIEEQIASDRFDMDYVEYRIRRADGSERWIEDFGHYVPTEVGPLFYVFINDATEKHARHQEEIESVNAELESARARETEHRSMLRGALSQAEAANVAKNAFLSNMSHDIRTPLNAVVGYADLIRAHLDEPERVRTYTERVLDASHQLLDVVNETLEISRMEAGHVQLVAAECSLSNVVEQVERDFREAAERRAITLEANVSRLSHDRAITDVVRLVHLLSQLVDNALKYSPPHSTVRLTAEEVPGGAGGFSTFRFIVADEGIGMEPAFMERMFLPFERESNTTASGVQGTGLGLTIVRNILDLMQGTLAVESEPGRGSVFTVTLALRLVRDEGDGALLRIPHRTGAVHHVLLVEDNALNSEIARCLLEDAGYTVDAAENGRIAVDMICAADPSTYDLVLMDIQMPVMDGYAATRAIRALPDPLRATVPIIAVSANAFSEDRRRSLESGMDAHLAKPLDINRLQALISTVVG